MPTSVLQPTASMGASGRVLPTDVKLAPGGSVTLDDSIAVPLLAADSLRIEEAP